MSATLLLLEQALAGWRKWPIPLTCQPTLCRRLAGGQSNQTFLLDAGDTQLVLRLGLAGAELLGVDRRTELQVLLVAAKAGLAPKPLYAEPDSGLLVTEYVEGIKPVQSLFANPPWQTMLSKSIESLRELSVNLAPYPYRKQMNSYWQQLSVAGHPGLEQQYLNAISALDLLEASSASLSLVHHDLNAENLLIVEDQLMLLDWEYAGQGYTIIDDVALLRLGLDLCSSHPAKQWAAAQTIAGFLDKGWHLLR
jgi:thiamine kinase